MGNYKGQIQRLQETLSDKESTEQNLNVKLIMMEQKLNNKDEVIQSLRKDFERLRDSQSETMNEMETLRGEYNEFQHKFHMEMQSREDVSAWKQKYKEESERYIALCDQMRQRDRQLHEIQQRTKELEEQLFDVQLDMDQLQIQHSEEVAALQETIDRSEKESTKKTNLKDNEIVQLKS